MIFCLLTCQNTNKNIQRIPKKQKLTKKKLYKYVTSSSGLVLRQKPKRRSNRITTLPYASKVEILQEFGEEKTISGATGKWLQVRYKGKKGWAFGGFLVEHLFDRETMFHIEELEEND
ncbi:MAG: SH3 domain-containing protein [Spirochaetota bacterium]